MLIIFIKIPLIKFLSAIFSHVMWSYQVKQRKVKLSNFSIINSYIPLMFRSIPVSNKICFDKEVKRSWKIHQEKMVRMKSNVSRHRPQKFSFLDQRMKKLALQQMRNIEVDRQNQILLRKIRNIQSKGCKNSYTRIYQDLSEQKKKTLNQPYRKRELIKIVEQNQQILKRLQHKRSEYSIKKMEKERKEIEKNINLISEFPYKDYPVTHTNVNLWATADGFYPQMRASQVKQQKFTFKGYKKIEGNNFVITTYLSKGIFYMEIQNVENKSEKYRIELPQQQARDLLDISYGNQIENMIQNLSIDQQKQYCYLKYASGKKVQEPQTHRISHSESKNRSKSKSAKKTKLETTDE